jgi:NAD(P)-dependent dehydrogenase (short-subunit alcohol dehydrogenase family)
VKPPVPTLKDKLCVITGAASGIGRATAIAAARAGARVALTDVQAEPLDEVARETGAVAHRALNIADYEAVKAFAADVHAAHGSADVAMNIAGIAIWGAVENLEHEQWRRVVDVNLMGPIHVIECFVPEMIRAGRGGQIVNVSSAAGLLGFPWHAPYSATKFGLRGVSEVLRFDLRRHRIGVTLVCPGGVDTGLVNTIEVAGVDTESARMRKLRKVFQRRAHSAEDAAKAILDGVVSNRYLVYTSRDVHFGFLVQRYAPFLYTRAFQIANDQFVRALEPR